MKFYKILIDRTFIGAVHSGQFVSENATRRKLFHSDEEHGQFVEYKGILYRDYWMQPVVNDSRIFTIADIREITEEEYNAYMEAIINNDTIDDEPEEEEEEIVPTPVPDVDEGLEFVRDSKINAMSHACRVTIEQGFDIELRGKTHHFSLTIQDQLNLMSLGATMQTDSLIPYHADGEETAFYSANEINQVIAAAQAHKNYQTAYYNSLKAYINSLDTIEAIAAITYGTPIPDEYKSDVLMVLE